MVTSARLGFPAINDPRGAAVDMRGLQQVVANIRERFKSVDAAIVTLQSTTVTTVTASADLAALKKQITNLQAELDALEEVVAGLTTGGGFETDPRTEQLAGELQGLQDVIDSISADPGRLPQLESAVGALQRQVDDIDPVGQTPAHSAMLQQLQDQIDSINKGVLL